MEKWLSRYRSAWINSGGYNVKVRNKASIMARKCKNSQNKKMVARLKYAYKVFKVCHNSKDCK